LHPVMNLHRCGSPRRKNCRNPSETQPLGPRHQGIERKGKSSATNLIVESIRFLFSRNKLLKAFVHQLLEKSRLVLDTEELLQNLDAISLETFGFDYAKGATMREPADIVR
jgi:hypothetical protein